MRPKKLRSEPLVSYSTDFLSKKQGVRRKSAFAANSEAQGSLII